MVIIGFGNQKGGVATTTLVHNFAALIQRTGCSVAIAEMSDRGESRSWCTSRSLRERRVLNGDRRGIGYFYLDDASDLRFAPQLVHYDYVLLDYSNSRQDIEPALRVAQHWVAPFRVNDANSTVLTYESWCWLRRRGSVAGETFSGLLTFVAGDTGIGEDSSEGMIEDDRADYADERTDDGIDHSAEDPIVDTRAIVSGDAAVTRIAAEAPLLHVLARRLMRNAAYDDTHDGGDVFAGATLDDAAATAAADLEAVWSLLLQRWKQGPDPVPPPVVNLGLRSPLEAHRRYLVPLPAGIRGR